MPPRENKVDAASEKRTEYAFWAIPGTSSAVTYSLSTFHEVDFAVNEGFRKIPHGGIEEGGLLFGTIDSKGTRIEAFRPIQCEHASGPSFLLSEPDLAALTQQLADAAADPDLAGLQPVGWFLAHTRGPLVMTDTEAELFDHYFGQTGMLTVLVKPERFQPTRFGFLVRKKDGSVQRDASQNAVILPLPGRNAKAGNGPMASIPAPAVSATAVKRAAEVERGEETRAEELEPLEETPPLAVAKEEATHPGDDVPAKKEGRQGSKRHRKLNLDQVRPKEESDPGPSASKGKELTPLREVALEQTHHEEIDMLDPYRQMEQIEMLGRKKQPISTTARLVMVLPLAAFLGCLVGYVAYLQVPSPIIPLTVKGRGQTVIVSWPPEQTRGAVYAAVRVDDSTPVMLTPDERQAGRVEVTASADMKVELIARNWIHDSRGVVRYVKPVANTAPAR